GRHAGRAPRRGGRARLLRLGSSHPRAARPLSGGEGHRDHGGGVGRGLPRADWYRRRRRGGGGLMSYLEYTRYELLRTFRNRRFVVFALGFPLVLYLAIALPNRHETDLGGSGLSAPLYFMVGLITFGTMNAVLSTGGRIAAERTAGWNRQLRL